MKFLFVLIVISFSVKAEIKSPCPKRFVFEPNKSEDDRWYGLITLESPNTINGVTLELEFDKSVKQLGNWLGRVTSDDDNLKFTIRNSNKVIEANTPIKFEIYAVYDPYTDLDPPALTKIRLNGREICPNYEEETVVIVKTNINVPTVLLEVPKCGVAIPTTTGFITHGQDTIRGQWPWHAALYRKEGSRRVYMCGGTLIDNQRVLTAAHCTTVNDNPRNANPINAKDLVVILGKHALLEDGKQEQVFNIKKVVVHEEFSWRNFFNDISILLLATPIVYSDYVRPICLWDQSTDISVVVNKTGTVVGWGRDHNNNPSTDLLMMAHMPIVDHLKCIYSHREFYNIFTNERNFCAGYRNDTSVCNGDSGGGLVFPKPGTSGANTVWELRGIVSNSVSAMGVCDTNYYVIFTDVAQFLDWIKIHADNYEIEVPKCGVAIPTTAGFTPFSTQKQHTIGGQWPWHAALYKKDGSRRVYMCGGTLIDNQRVLTAAHCTTVNENPRNAKDLVVILGKRAFWVDGKQEQVFNIKKVVVHEEFSTRNYFNDISILLLATPIVYSDYVRPICLWDQSTDISVVVNKTGTAVGWGRDHNNTPTDLLMMAHMPVVDHLQCIFSYPGFYSVYLNGKSFCAGYRNGTPVCTGESGGGLVFPKPGTSGANTVWELRGIVSNSVAKQEACDPEYYVIFTDVAKFLDWIKIHAD